MDEKQQITGEFETIKIKSAIYIECHFEIFVQKIRSSRQEVFCKKSVLGNFAKFTGKHLRQGLFLIKLHAQDLTNNYLLNLKLY